MRIIDWSSDVCSSDLLQASRNLPTAPLMAGQGGMSLRQRLSNIVTHPTKARATGFIAKEVIEAFELVASELQKRAIVAKVTQLDDGAKLTVHHGDAAEDFTYAVRMISQPIPAFALSDAARSIGEKKRFYRTEVFLNNGGRRSEEHTS